MMMLKSLLATQRSHSILTSASSVSVSCLVSSLHAVIRSCAPADQLQFWSEHRAQHNTVIIFRGKSGNIKCLSYESVVVSPVEILIFVCEAFYPGKERTPGLSHGCHELSVYRPQQRGSRHYTDSKDWASASCWSRLLWVAFTRSDLSQRQWILTVQRYHSLPVYRPSYSVTQMGLFWIYSCFELWILAWFELNLSILSETVSVWSLKGSLACCDIYSVTGIY